MDERKESVKLRVRSAAKSFSARKEIFEAVDDVSLDVYENEFLVILGPGQCGKSVLLNMISGLETPTAGTIEFTGGNRNLGFVFQKTAVFPWIILIPLRLEVPAFAALEEDEGPVAGQSGVAHIRQTL